MAKFNNFLVLLMLVACIVGAAVMVGDITGVVDVYRAQQATRRAEAEAARLQAAVNLARAQADVETARGERAVLEAAARAVDADRRLVTWYTLRGDLRGLLVFVGTVGLAICVGGIVVMVRGWQDENK